MQVGKEYRFLRRISPTETIKKWGVVISNNKVTSDGIPYVEVRFDDGVRKYVHMRG